MEIKAINIKQQEFKDLEEFFLSCEVFIGPKNESYVYEVYDFNVISLKKLYDDFEDNGIVLNRGWMIMKYYDEDVIKNKITSIIRMCVADTDEQIYYNLGMYFRKQE